MGTDAMININLMQFLYDRTFDIAQSLRSQRLKNLALTLDGRHTTPSIKYTH
jgi:hypothetical protein